VVSAFATYVGLLVLLWFGGRQLPLGPHLHSIFPDAFASFALLLAPLWLFGFGLGEWLRGRSQSRAWRILLPAILGVPYLVFAIPAGNFHWFAAAVMFGLPVVLSALLEFSSLPPKLAWQDALVLAVLVAIYMLRLLAHAWLSPQPAAFSKLYIADLALYLYLVVRRLGGMGYSFAPRGHAFLTGLREWLYFLPFALGLGFALHFIHFHAAWPSPLRAAETLLVTFLLIAIPEEMFFRGILQNLLETRLGRRMALLTAALLFGLAHFNKGAAFNWRYVLLAAIAGIFYGRAWRERRQLLASVITHTAVDVLWALWFR